jgi:hypothetical protein
MGFAKKCKKETCPYISPGTRGAAVRLLFQHDPIQTNAVERDDAVCLSVIIGV